MTLFPSREILRRRADIGLIAVFLVFIWLPVADSFLRLDQAPSPNENRALARFPEFHFSVKGVGDFLTGLERHFNDHFGFRRQLVRWEQQLKWNLFRDFRAANVVAGKAEWLFYSDGRMLDDINGSRPFKESELESWRRLLVGRRDWLAQRGIRYLFVIAPDKHTIYPEHLPDWFNASARRPGRVDQFVAHMKAHSDVPILDLRAALLEAKQRERVYLFTDTHWNDHGAFAASRRLVETLTALGVPGHLPDPAAFQESTIEETGGDLARMLGRGGAQIGTGKILVPQHPPLPAVTVRVDPILIAKKWIPNTEPHVSLNPSALGKVIMFRDSFAELLEKFFGYSYGRVVYVWQQNWDKAVIEREMPDVVIDEMLERFLIFRDPEELRKKDEEPDAQLFGDR